MREVINLKSATDDKCTIVSKSDTEYFVNMNYKELADLFRHPVEGKLDEKIEKIFATDYFFYINGLDIDGEIKDYIDLSNIFLKTVKFIDKQMSVNNLNSMSSAKLNLVYRFNSDSGIYIFGVNGWMRI